MKSSCLFCIILLLLSFGIAFSQPSEFEMLSYPELGTAKDLLEQSWLPYGPYVLVAGDNVNLRSEPSVLSKVIANLPESKRVVPIKISNEKINLEGKGGYWLYIKDPKNNAMGWVFDYFIGYKNRFKKVEKWNVKSIGIEIGDTTERLVCTKEGTFSGEIIGIEGPTEKIKGEILQFRNLVWLKKDKEDRFPLLFYFDKKGSLKIQEYYDEGIDVEYFNK